MLVMRILGRVTTSYSNNVFKTIPSVGTKAALGNSLPNKLDTASKFATSSMFTN